MLYDSEVGLTTTTKVRIQWTQPSLTREMEHLNLMLSDLLHPTAFKPVCRNSACKQAGRELGSRAACPGGVNAPLAAKQCPGQRLVSEPGRRTRPRGRERLHPAAATPGAKGWLGEMLKPTSAGTPRLGRTRMWSQLQQRERSGQEDQLPRVAQSCSDFAFLAAAAAQHAHGTLSFLFL